MSDKEREGRVEKRHAPASDPRRGAGDHLERCGTSRGEISTHQRANAALAKSPDPVATMIGKSVRFASKMANGDSATLSGVVIEQSQNGSEVGIQVYGYPDLHWLPVSRVAIAESSGSKVTEHRVVVTFTLTGDGDHAKAAAEIKARIGASVLDKFGADGEKIAASDYGRPRLRRDQLHVSAEPVD